LLLSEHWPAPSTWPASYIALLVFVNIPVIAIILNVVRQLLTPRNPSLPPEIFSVLPVIGSAIDYGTDPIGFFERCRKKHGDVFTFTLIGRKMTVCLGAKGSNLVLGGKLSQVSAEDAYTHLTTPVFGKDVVYDVPNHILMEQKKFVKFGLSVDNFRAYVGMIENEVLNFMKTDSSFYIYHLDDINEWGTFHAFRVLSQITILTASRTLQGEEVRSHMNKDFADYFHDLDGGFTPLNFLFPNLPLPSYKRRDKAQRAMSDFYVNILEKRRKGESDHEHDMIEALCQQTYKDGRALTDREIAHIMIALLMAGQHTSSASTSWSLLHLADRPDVAEALYKEQAADYLQADGTWRTMTYEELKKLPLLDAVIRETLRLHPPLHSLMRKVIGDIPVPPSLAAYSEDQTYTIPKGNFVMAVPAVSQVDSHIWHDALTWDPYRWLDPEGAAANAYNEYNDASEKVDFGFGAISKGTESPYQPFGAGRHRCIGEQFAYVQLGTILTTLIRHLEFRLDKPFPKHNYQTMIVLPKDPCDVRYRRRAFEAVHA